MAQEDKANVGCNPRVAFSLAQLPWDIAGRAHKAKHLHKVSNVGTRYGATSFLLTGTITDVVAMHAIMTRCSGRPSA